MAKYVYIMEIETLLDRLRWIQRIFIDLLDQTRLNERNTSSGLPQNHAHSNS